MSFFFPKRELNCISNWIVYLISHRKSHPWNIIKLALFCVVGSGNINFIPRLLILILTEFIIHLCSPILFFHIKQRWYYKLLLTLLVQEMDGCFLFCCNVSMVSCITPKSLGIIISLKTLNWIFETCCYCSYKHVWYHYSVFVLNIFKKYNNLDFSFFIWSLCSPRL